MSGTPHMVGRRGTTDDERDEPLPASALLDDAGKIDPRKVKSIANSNVDKDRRVTAAEADEMRRRIRDGETVAAVSKSLGRSQPAVVKHARGEAEYPNGAPSVEPVECHRRVTAAEADEMRRRLLRGESVETVSRALGRSESTIYKHAKANRGGYPGGEPGIEPLVYDGGGWEEVR